LAEPSSSWQSIVTLIVSAILFGTITTATKEKLISETTQVVTLILLGLFSSLLIGYFVSRKRKVNTKEVVNVGVHYGLFRLEPLNLIEESSQYLRLLENEAKESIIKNILKLTITAPKKAIETTTQLVKQQLPEGSEARRNYLSLLKDAYHNL
jgi:hypothetical protein